MGTNVVSTERPNAAEQQQRIERRRWARVGYRVGSGCL